MENELLELLEKLVAEAESEYTSGNYGRRDPTAKEQEALDVGRGLIKLLRKY